MVLRWFRQTSQLRTIPIFEQFNKLFDCMITFFATSVHLYPLAVVGSVINNTWREPRKHVGVVLTREVCVHQHSHFCNNAPAKGRVYIMYWTVQASA